MDRHLELRFRAGDASLAGTLMLPPDTVGDDGSTRLPWALLVGSWLPRDRDGAWDRAGHPAWFTPAAPDEPEGPLARLADALAERGVASFRYDPRGTGASDGAWEGSDLFARIDDARDAIGAMRSRPELDLRRTAIIGHGEGGVIALSVAIGDPAIGAVGLLATPARAWRDVLRRGVGTRDRTGVDRQHPFVAALDRQAEELLERADRREPEAALDIGGERVGLRLALLEQAVHTPALALATMLHRPTVLAHAADDAWVHPDESRLLADTLAEAGNEPLLQVVERGGHRFEDEGALEAFAAAIAERMAPRELPPVLIAIEEMRSPND